MHRLDGGTQLLRPAAVVGAATLGLVAAWSAADRFSAGPPSAASQVFGPLALLLLAFGAGWSLVSRRRQIAPTGASGVVPQRVREVLFAASGDSLVLIDRDLRITFVGSSLAQMVGTKPSSVDQDALLLVHPEDRAPVQHLLEEIIAGSPGGRLTVRIRRHDGAWRWLQCTYANHLDDPALQCIVTNTHDITEQRAHENSVLALLLGSAELTEAITVERVVHVVGEHVHAAVPDAVVEVRLVSRTRGHFEPPSHRRGAGPRRPEGEAAPIPLDGRDPHAVAARRRTALVLPLPVARPAGAAGGVDPTERYGMVLLPMVASGRTVGIVHVEVPEAGLPDEVVRNALLSFANQAAVAIERVRLIAAQANAVRVAASAADRADAMRNVARAFSRSLTPDEVLEAATRALDRVFRPAAVAASLIDVDGVLRTRTLGGSATGGFRAFAVPLDAKRAMAAVARDGRSRWYANRAEMAAGLGPDNVTPPEVQASATVALRDGPVRLGVLSLGMHEPRAFQADERDLIESIAALCSEALKRARLYTKEREAVRRWEVASAGYERIFRRNPLPMLVRATSGAEVLAVNDALVASTRSSEADLLATAWDELVTGPGMPSGMEPNGCDGGQLVRVRRADGSSYPAELVGLEAMEFDGMAAELQILVDQTRRIEAERARRRLEAQLDTVADDGRRRLAEELHDGPVQYLSSVSLRLIALRRRASDAGVGLELLERIDRAREGVEVAVDDLRSTMMRLFPPDFDDVTLADAIARAVPDLDAQVEGPEVHVEDHLRHDPGPQAKAVLYRAALEALSNVRKHAGAEHAWVVLAEDAGHLVLTVEDDGIGVDVERLQVDRLPDHGHLGLLTMRNRFVVAGGTWSLARRSPCGTRLTARLPIVADDVEPER